MSQASDGPKPTINPDVRGPMPKPAGPDNLKSPAVWNNTGATRPAK